MVEVPLLLLWSAMISLVLLGWHLYVTLIILFCLSFNSSFFAVIWYAYIYKVDWIVSSNLCKESLRATNTKGIEFILWRAAKGYPDPGHGRNNPDTSVSQLYKLENANFSIFIFPDWKVLVLRGTFFTCFWCLHMHMLIYSFVVQTNTFI